MKKNLNPIIKCLLKLKIIQRKNIYIFHKKTRDKKIRVLKDRKTGVIFLEKSLTNYKKFIIRKKFSDTLIAIASK